MNALFESCGLHLTPQQLEDFERYYELLVSENEKYNLTAITEKQDVYIKHFLDSILVTKMDFDFKGKTLIDIGTGAGFPSIPLKIVSRETSVTGLDALKKRIGFLEMVRDTLALDQMSFVHGRAEDFGQNPDFRGQYDFAVSRAVAELRLLLEYVMPFVKVGGYFLAYKSLKSKTELDDAHNALSLLQSELVDEVKFQLPDDQGVRDILLIRKKGDISMKYPRKAGTPKKNPL